MSAQQGESAADGRTTVLYITGSGRSGSTLLERILGACPGFVNVGELIEVFRSVAPFDERCGCGQRFSECEFWRAVGEHAFGGWSPHLTERIAALQRAVARQRRLPRLLTYPRGGEQFRRNLASYHDAYQQLFAAIREQAKAQVVVDASKWPAQGLALAKAPALDVRLLHLVRDVRGVAYSWAKSGVARPHAVGESRNTRRTMATHPVTKTSLHWSAFQTEVEVIGRVVRHHARLRYEDLIADPVAAVDDTLRRLGLPLSAEALGHLNENGVILPASHGVSGNPSRFKVGFQPMRLDETWRESMDRQHRWTASLMGMPALLRYGYLHGEPMGRSQ